MPADKPAETPAPPAAPEPQAPPQFTPEQIALIQANQRASAAEQRAAAAENYARQAPQQAPRPARPDPLDRYAAEDIVMSAEDKKRTLSEAIDTRARAAAEAAYAQGRRENAQEREAMRAEFALHTVMSQRPELNNPSNASNFAAAMTKAKFEAEAQGINLSPAQLAMRAADAYDGMFGRKDPQRVPYVEGAARPDMSPAPEAGKIPQPSFLEKVYKMKTGKIREMYDVNNPEEIGALNNEYVNAKNKPLMDRGINSEMAEISGQINSN